MSNSYQKISLLRKAKGGFGCKVRRRTLGKSSALTFELLETRNLLSANAIVAENLLPGNPASEWDIAGVGDPTIQGYATDISVDQGGSVDFKIDNSQLAPYQLEIYRIGYYGGDGARLVDTIDQSQTLAISQPDPLTDPATGLVDAGNWEVTASWDVPETATSGVYIARVERTDTGGASHIIFVVRDDDGESDLLFQTADTTWQAYNRWGGNSFYVGPYNGRAYAVSYNRPFDTRATTAKDWFFSSEYATVRWLERNGYDVSYTTGVDTDRYGSELLEHDVFLSVGHDEYWSADQRANVEAARAAGVDLAFFSGNEVYWKTRWETSIDGSGDTYRTLVSYKETWDNAKIDPEETWTGTWRDGRFSSDGGYPENALTGQIFTVNRGPGGDTGTPFTVDDSFSDLSFWRDTRVADLQPGEIATVGDYVLGYEWDEDLDNGFRPAGLFQLSSTTQQVPQKIDEYGTRNTTEGTATHSLTLYRAQSGALVFGAGTINWGWGLDGTHDVLQSTPDPAIQQATVNLFADMGVQPQTLQSGLVYARMSTDLQAPLSTITSVSSGANAVGGVPVTINGTAEDIDGEVAGVEVSTDGGQSWRRADGRDVWSYTWIPTATGPTEILSRAVDDSANLETAVAGFPVTVALAPTSSAGLVAAYNFDEGSATTLIDSALNNNGSIAGATFVPGFHGQALSFDGVDDIVTIAGSDSLDLSSGMTLEAWVQPSDLDNWTTILLKENGESLAYGLYASDDTGNPPAGYVNVANGNQRAFGNSALAIGQWQHLTLTHDAAFLQLYVNGTLVSRTAANGPISNSNEPLRIGGNTVFPNEFFQGLIDEVRVYNRPLSQSEIFYNMSTPVGGVTEAVAPTATISAPSEGQTVTGDTTIVVSANDNVAVGEVILELNGAPFFRDSTFPYEMQFNANTLPNGQYTLTGQVLDVAGNSAAIPARTFQVFGPADTNNPEITFLNPVNGQPVSSTIVLEAFATDNIQVASVQFQVDGVDVGDADLQAPYRVAWDSSTVADGSYTITAIATDASGNTQSQAMTVSIDNTAPTIVSTTPVDGATGESVSQSLAVDFSEDIQWTVAQFQLSDSQEQPVAATLVYDETLRQLTLQPSQLLLPGETYTVQVNQIEDLAGNAMASAFWTFQTSNSVVDASLWSDQTVPAIASANDSDAVELGVQFQTTIDGVITGLRFYKGPANTGTHVGNLWTSTGTLLASATFTDETATGWQEVSFDSPVFVTANTAYVASYFAPNGGYSADTDYFANAYSSGPLVVLPGSGNNSSFFYGLGGGFPTDSVGMANYWVDVRFSNEFVDNVAPEVSTTTPADGASAISISSGVAATFSESVTPVSIVFELRDNAGALIPSSFEYSDIARTATLTPTTPLQNEALYTATVSNAADASGNVMQPFSWSFTTQSAVDTVPPTIVSRFSDAFTKSVSTNAVITAMFNEPVAAASLLVELTYSDGQNTNNTTGTIAYNDSNNTVSFTPDVELLAGTTYEVTITAEDLAGNGMSDAWTFTTASVVSGATIFDPSTVPQVASANDTAAVELGVKFTASSNGYVSGLRFYKGTLNTGTHVGNLWTSNGILLGSATFSAETSSGWQQVDFSEPIAVDANTTYVASYFAPNGGYSFNSTYFAGGSVTSGPLTALGNDAGGNGLYRYANDSVFPNQSFNATNYWVDVVFESVVTDIFPPAVISQSPSPDTTDVETSAAIEVTFSEPVDFNTINITLADALDQPVAATLGYDSLTRTATLTPSAPLDEGTAYTATVSGATDLAGNLMSPATWTFTTATPAPLFSSIWDPQTIPAVESANDPSAVELGVKFQATTEGIVTDLRFYKGALNTGTHVGSLWTEDGTLLASATYTDETATGWQQVELASPVSLTANTTYVVSYYAPDGGYAFNSAYFASGSVTNGNLTALGNDAGGNGLYRYGAGGGFPDASFNATNYWVDVVFEATPVSAALAVQTAPLASLQFAIFDPSVVDKNQSLESENDRRDLSPTLTQLPIDLAISETTFVEPLVEALDDARIASISDPTSDDLVQLDDEFAQLDASLDLL